MKLFAAGLQTETNTFSPIPTGLRNYQELGLSRAGTAGQTESPNTALVRHWIDLAAADGHELVTGLVTSANPAGRTTRPVYEALRDELLRDLKRSMPVDVVLLTLHGAMVADGYDDCEGDILSRVRALVGPDCVVAAEIDPHCHATEQMFAAATLIIAFKEYPHTDILERGTELYRIAVAAARGECRPTMALFDCRMIGSFHTTREPMRSFVDSMTAEEAKDGVLSLSFGHSFAWADVADVGAKMWAVTDGDPARAAELAAAFGRKIFALRAQTVTPLHTIDQAIDLALQPGHGSIVVSDTADNAGGGAPSDSTFILRGLIERSVDRVVSGVYWDPVAVQLCAAAGVGANILLRVGGKAGPTSGQPIDLSVTVMAVAERHAQTGLAGVDYSFGPSVWVRSGGIDLVLSSVRQQVFHPDAFGRLGLDLADYRMIVVKSSQHFYRNFVKLAQQVVYVTTPGNMNQDYANLPYTKRGPNYWPRVDDPFAV